MSVVVAKQARWSDAGKLFLFTLLLTPIATLIHELGHFAVPIIFDLPAQLHPTRVSGGAELGGGAPVWMVVAQVGGGPLLTVAMTLIGGFLFSRDRRRLWALAFAVAAVHRLLVTTAYLAMRLFFAMRGMEFGGTPNFDEHNVAVALNFSPVIVSIAATGFLVFVLLWLFRRIERGSRTLFALTLILAMGIGNFGWSALAPPVLATTG